MRFADAQKKATMSGFMPLMMSALHEVEAYLSGRPREISKFMCLVKTRVKYLYKNTLMVAAGVLNPEAHYKFGYGNNPIFAKALKKAIEKIADSPQSEVKALAQFVAFRSCRGKFDSRGARLASSQMSPSA